MQPKLLFRKNILLPLLAAILLVCSATLVGLSSQQISYTEELVKKQVNDINISLQQALDRESQTLKSLLFLIAKKQDLHIAWKQKNRDTLLKSTQPILDDLYIQHGITHFSLHDLNKTNILRTHQPDLYGDTINHHALNQAEESLQPSSGLELGEYGWLILRVVVPWYIDGQLSGYIELGSDLDNLNRNIFMDQQVNAVITVPKTLLDYEKWKQAHKTPQYNWNTLSTEIVSSHTYSEIPNSVIKYIYRTETSNVNSQIMEIGDSLVYTHTIPIYDAEKRVAGNLHITIDMTELKQNQRQQLTVTFLAVTSISLLLFSFVAYLTTRQEKAVKATYEKLTDEVNQRCRAQEHLQEIKSELEDIVKKRTVELENEKKQLTKSIQDKEAMQAQLQESEQRYRTLFEQSADPMLLGGLDGFVECNTAALALFKSQKSEVIGRQPWDISPASQADGVSSKERAEDMINQANNHGRHRFEWLHKDAKGHTFPAEISLTQIPLRNQMYYHAIVRDITDRKLAEEKIRQQAHYDLLTHLPNRNLFMDRLQQALEHAKTHDIYGAVLFFDLDHFKRVNDSLGHDTGDALLQSISKRLSKSMRSEDTLARFGGDEFVILLSDQGPDADKALYNVRLIAEKIRKQFQKPFKVKRYEFHLTPSIGATLFPNQNDTVEDIMKHSDAAMYKAKENGRDTICFFEQHIQQSLEDRLELEKGLRTAFQKQQFTMVYQPKLSREREIKGAEALIRWQHPEQGFISPAEFIPVAEEMGLIIRLTDWIFEETLSTYQALSQHHQGNESFNLSINISPVQFRQPELVDNIINKLNQFQVPACGLTLEVTEGLLLEDFRDADKKLKKLRDAGIKISIDDFGTGYSSLSYLTQLDISELKIDQSFVRNLHNSETDTAIAETILSMAKHLNLHVVAEGVETQEQFDFLLAHDCPCFQGYLFSKPVSEKDFNALMLAQATHDSGKEI